MIIVASRFGSHSNRLIQNLHFEAFCKENNIEYINPSFSNMRKYYKDPCKINKGLKGIFLRRKLAGSIFKRLGSRGLLTNTISFAAFEDANRRN